MYLSQRFDATNNVPKQFMSPVTFQNGMPLKESASEEFKDKCGCPSEKQIRAS